MKWQSISSVSVLLGLVSPTVGQVTPQNITSSTFLRRAWHSSIVAGNWLYLDGGEINFMFNDAPQAYPSDKFFSLDLSVNWTAQSAPFNFLDKPSNTPSLNKGALWYFSEGGTIFAEFSGETSQLPPAFNQTWPLSIWRFTPDGKGSGGWNETIFPSDPTWAHFTRPSSGLTAFSPDGGVYLGGVSTFTTSPQTNSLPPNVDIPLPGMITHGFQSGIFANESAAPFGGLGTAQDGAMVYVPTFGTEGLYVTLGGATTGLVEDQNNPPTNRPMDNITVYDPSTDTWYWQQATGNIPDPRINTCATGVQSGSGENATYEIFLYNGYSGEFGPDNEALDGVYILTLPAFQWTKINGSGKGARFGHTCHTIGNRQMLIVGGGDPTKTGSMSDTFFSPDPFPQGLGIFDMTALSWKTTYFENAPPYEKAQSIKSIYADGSRFPPNWTQPAFEVVIKTLNPVANNNQTSTTSHVHHSSGGKIAGGVIGSLILLGLIVAGAWFFVRRNKRIHRRQYDQRHFQFQFPSQFPSRQDSQPPSIPRSMSTAHLNRTPSADEPGYTLPRDIAYELKEEHLQELSGDSYRRSRIGMADGGARSAGDRTWYRHDREDQAGPVELEGAAQKWELR